MKTIYECEYCGERYTDYEECKKCEDVHRTFTNDLDSVLKPLFTYPKNGCLPETAVLAVDLGGYDSSTKTYTHKYVLGEYRIVRKMPKETQAALIAKHEMQQQEAIERWEQYKLAEQRSNVCD